MDPSSKPKLRTKLRLDHGCIYMHEFNNLCDMYKNEYVGRQQNLLEVELENLILLKTKLYFFFFNPKLS